jgi:hypothetical protein
MLPAGCCSARKVLSCPRLNPECCPVKRQKCEEVVDEEEEEEEGAGEEEEGGEGEETENPTEPPCNNFKWNGTLVGTGNKATGKINNIGFTYTSNKSFTIIDWMQNNRLYPFPSEYNIPGGARSVVRNTEVSHNVLNFSSPIENPVIVLASIGNPTTAVSVKFSKPVNVIFSAGAFFKKDSSTKITGKEAFVLVQMNGTHSSISFDYLNAEVSVDFMFGANFPCE